jgi:hypothetical protein
VSASLRHQAEKRWVAIFVDSIRRGYFNSFGQKPRHILEYFMNGRSAVARGERTGRLPRAQTKGAQKRPEGARNRAGWTTFFCSSNSRMSKNYNFCYFCPGRKNSWLRLWTDALLIVLVIQADATSSKSAPPHHFIIKQVIIMQSIASLSKQNFDHSNVQLPGTVQVVFVTSDCVFPVEVVCAPAGLSVCNCQKLLHYYFGEFFHMSPLSSP